MKFVSIYIICDIYFATVGRLAAVVIKVSIMEKIHQKGLNVTLQRAEIFAPGVHTATLAVCTVLVIFVLVMGCFGNGLVILTALQAKKLRTNFDLLIVNLAGADFVMCSCLAPIFLFLLFSDPPRPQIFCGSFLFLGTTCGMLSLLTLVAISLHRQARVVGQAKGTLTARQAIVILVIVWTISLAMSLGGTFHITANWNNALSNCQMVINSHDRRTFNFVLYFLAPVSIISFIIITISYIIIAWAVQVQSRIKQTPSANKGHRTTKQNGDKSKKSQIVVCGKDGNRKIVIARTTSSHSASGPGGLDKDNKAVTMCLVVTITIVLCWGPLIVSQFIELLVGEYIILYQVKICGIALVFLNSALDPYIYAQHSGKMRRQYVRFFKNALNCQCFIGKTTKLRVFGRGNLEVNRHKAAHNNDADTRTVNLPSPKIQQKCTKPAIAVDNQRTKQPCNIVPILTTIRSDRNIYSPSVKKSLQVSDLQSVVHDVKSLVHKTCCHVPPKEEQSLIEA